MGCEEAIEKLDSYLGCELSEIEEYNIKKHLDRCLRCSQEYSEMENMFETLSDHEMVMIPLDFTENILSEVNCYERKKSIKEVFLVKGVASVIAAGLITAVFNFVQYRPINLFTQIYKSSDKISKMVVVPMDKLSKELREIKQIAEF